ncbi:MAG TPA: hypothetical protein VN605_15355 [Thermoanaerobaculia bacterium]|nr:hypothetical protein [Thermoanaerobaculia bacterium]
MNRRLFSAAAIVVALAAPAAFAKNDAMSLIPNDAVTVGVVRLADARTSPLSSMLFQQTDKVTTDGDAEQFLKDAGLEPTKDVDVLVVSTAPRAALGHEADILVAAEGRFNIERLTAALITRGAVKKNGYFLLPESDSKKDSGPTNGAVAFLDSHLAVVGSEGAVTEAIASHAAGGTTFITASGLGRDLARVDPKATAFALVDVPRASRLTGGMNIGHSKQGQAVNAALKGVSTVAIWATDAGDSLKLGAFGLATDEETLGLLEDTLRGALAAMRLAISDKAPDLVTVLRRFTVARTNDSVTVSGSLPAETIKTFAAKAKAHHSDAR